MYTSTYNILSMYHPFKAKLSTYCTINPGMTNQDGTSFCIFRQLRVKLPPQSLETGLTQTNDV